MGQKAGSCEWCLEGRGGGSRPRGAGSPPFLRSRLETVSKPGSRWLGTKDGGKNTQSPLCLVSGEESL